VQSNLTQNEPQPEPEQKVNADADDEKYKGWTDEEIAADKLRLEKAKKDAESAKLFASSSDVPNETVSWNIDVFNTNNTVNNVNNFSFEDGQRGIDLEAEAVLNKIKTDKSISFGVVTDNNETEPDFSNVTTRNVTSESSGLGMANFAFDGNNDNKPKDAQQVTTDTVSSWNISSNNEQETETSGWGSLGGGFSSVKTTEGFGNVQWGQSDDKNSGFGSFNTAETEQFDFGGLINDNAANQTQQTQGNEEEKVKETTNGQVDDEDNGNFTLTIATLRNQSFRQKKLPFSLSIRNMSHNQIPFTTQSNARYGMSVRKSNSPNTNGSFYNNKSYSSFTNQSFNASFNNGSSSMLYPGHKSKKFHQEIHGIIHFQYQLNVVNVEITIIRTWSCGVIRMSQNCKREIIDALYVVD